MTTPEGKVKQRINQAIDNYDGSVYRYMPVPAGYGKPSLDYIGCANGWFFAIEAKSNGKVATTRQEGTIEDMERAGARVFRINDDASLAVFAAWLAEVMVAG